MSFIDTVAADLAALENDLRRTPTRALRDADAMVEWVDEIRQRLRRARTLLAGDGPIAPPAPRPRIEAGEIRSRAGRAVRVECRNRTRG
ncbi:hypothetical protein [Microvirga yunnanensis]|uniref:hypothetical protein n=1 Tax=Microvirga yunnanensis TaxID=2953740 RepID=UPI0021C66490|nr:hypothetical protein [Microvirga sp. HBU65207]